MEQHPIPQNVTQYQFRLIGQMTLRQFGFLGAGIVLGIILYNIPLFPMLIRVPIAILCGLTGAALAFLPIEDRPLDVWLVNFLQSIYNPTQYLWNKQIILPDYFTYDKKNPAVINLPQINARDQKQLQAYLGSLQDQPQNEIDKQEDNKLNSITQLLNQTSGGSHISPPKTIMNSTTPTNNQTPTPTQPPARKTPQTTQVSQSQPPAQPNPQANINQLAQTATQPAPPRVTQAQPPQPTAQTVPPTTPASPQIVAMPQVSPTQATPSIQDHPLMRPTQPSIQKPTQSAPIFTAPPTQPQLTPQLTPKPLNAPVQKPTPQFSVPPTPSITPQPTTRPQSPAQPPQNIPMPKPAQTPPTQTQGQLVQGRIINTNNQPITNVLVEIKDRQNQTVRTTKTNNMGNYQISMPLPFGQFTVSCDHPQFNFNITPLTITTQKLTPVIILGIPKQTTSTQPQQQKQQLNDLINQINIPTKTPSPVPSQPKPAQTKTPSTPQVSKAPPLSPPINIKSNKQPERPVTTTAQFMSEIQMPITPDDPNTIVGMTLDKSQQLASNAIIEVLDQNNFPVRTIKSNNLGQFFISTPLKNGTYTIKTEHPSLKYNPVKLEATGSVIPPLKLIAS